MGKINEKQQNFAIGDYIYKIGDKAESLYLIHSGEVSILSNHGLELGILKDGEMFGEVGRVVGSPRTVTARAKTSCTLYEIKWEVVEKKLSEADPILVAVMRGLAYRISDANDLSEKYWRELGIYKSLEVSKD